MGYPSSFEEGGTDKFSHSLIALTGITNSREQPASRLLAILQPPTHTAESVAAVIRSQAPNTQVKVIPHHPVMMPVAKRARLSMRSKLTLGELPVLGDEISDANYCMRIEMHTEDAQEVKGWMPRGQLRKDVFALLKTYLGCDYDASLYLTLPVRLLPRPSLGDRDLFAGNNVMLGLTDDNENQMPQTMRMKVGKLRGRDFDEE